MQYCISVWGGAATNHLKAIVVIQKRIVRCFYHVPAMTSTNSLFVKTGILKLNEIFNFQVCKLMLNTLIGFEVDHSCFTPVNGTFTQYQTFKK